MRTLSPRTRKSGFTLMELLIVIIVIAVLAAIALPRFINSGLRSKEASLKGDLKIYRNATQLFLNDTEAFRPPWRPCPLRRPLPAASTQPAP